MKKAAQAFAGAAQNFDQLRVTKVDRLRAARIRLDVERDPLAFDQGNPAEDPPYGLWGILNDARVGGYIQIVGNEAGGPAMGAVEFDNIVYTPEPASLALFGLAALAAFRRR